MADLGVVGEKEIAERLGYQYSTVRMWKYRGLLPEPSGHIGGAPWWPWSVIRAWAVKTGRLKG